MQQTEYKNGPNCSSPYKYICLCTVTLEVLSYKLESISYAMNLGCHVICHGQDHVAVPSRGLGALGALLLSLLDPCHESPLGTEPSLLSVLAGVKEV